MGNRFAKLMRNTGPARFFVPVGIILIVFGIILMLFNSNDYLETTGTVTAVAEETNTENQTVYDVGFTYRVDGKDYSGTFEDLPKPYENGSEIKVFYNPENPGQYTNSKTPGFLPPVIILAGALAAVFGVYKTAKAFKQSRELEETAPGRGAPAVDFDGFKNAAGVTEYYCRHDGKALKPGYILERDDRTVLFEGRMAKQALVGARTFEFIDHLTGRTETHEVGHTMTQTYNDEFFSARSWFKFDGENIWDVLHNRGLRLSTNALSKFPNVIYEVSRNGKAFARIETSGQYVHEDDAAEHALNIPVGRYYYRVWTDSEDFETLFLTIFAVSETEQVFAE